MIAFGRISGKLPKYRTIGAIGSTIVFWGSGSWALLKAGYINQTQRDLLTGVNRMLVKVDMPLLGNSWIVAKNNATTTPGKRIAPAEPHFERGLYLTANLVNTLDSLAGFAAVRVKGLGFVNARGSFSMRWSRVIGSVWNAAIRSDT